jgi:hypothetical protein
MVFAALLVGLVIPAQVAAFDLNLSAGVKGGLSGAAVRGVPEGDPYTLNGQEYSVAQGPDMYAMFGLGGGVGGFLEARVLDIVGLEFGVFQSWDNGDGWEDKNDSFGRLIGRVNQEQRTRAIHIPVMVKASVPGLVRPTFGLGVEFVNQGASTYTYRSDTFNVSSFNSRYSIVPSKYTLLAFSFALEIDLGEIRIPIELRGGYNTGFKKTLKDRAVASGTNPYLANFEYDGKYEGHFALFTGVVYQYDLAL